MAKTKPSQSSSSASTGAIAHMASIFPRQERALSDGFVDAVKDLQSTLNLPVQLLIQDGNTPFDSINEIVATAFYGLKGTELKRGQRVAILIDSFGGSARSAFEIASLLRKYCGGFVAVIPRRAKSAATLVALGAEQIIMAEFGELGPLDMQLDVPEREERLSVLDETQSLERLNALALSSLDETMMLLLSRTGMKIATLLPHVRELVTGMMRPLFESVDVVRFTQMSRLLKVAEEYARRLLVPKFTPQEADTIARRLAENYPEHGFIIYRDEVQNLGLQPTIPTDEQEEILSRIISEMPGMTAIGTIQEITTP